MRTTRIGAVLSLSLLACTACRPQHTPAGGSPHTTVPTSARANATSAAAPTPTSVSTARDSCGTGVPCPAIW